MTWFIIIIAILVVLGLIGHKTEKKENDVGTLNRPPEPQEGRDYIFGEMGAAEYLTVNSVGGSWSDPEVTWSDIADTLEKYGFSGFDGYEEVELGGADMTWPEDQIKAAKALMNYAESFPNCESLPLNNGKRIYKSDILKLAHIFRSGRTIIPW